MELKNREINFAKTMYGMKFKAAPDAKKWLRDTVNRVDQSRRDKEKLGWRRGYAGAWRLGRRGR